MPFVGRYINMDASTERRDALEAQLERLGLADRYQRFAGIDGREIERSRTRLSPGELGCFMAHYRCIVESGGEGEHLHVMEDDVVIAPQAASLLERVTRDALGDCDLVFTDVFMPLDMQTLFGMMQQYRVSGMPAQRRVAPEWRLPAYVMYPSLAHTAFSGATSYFVNQASREKLLTLIEEEIEQGPNLPIDMLYRALVNQGRLTARCTMPFLTSIRADSICDTTIIGRNQHDESAMAFYALRSFFYLARDDEALGGVMGEINGRLEDVDYLGPALEFFRYVFSERFQIF